MPHIQIQFRRDTSTSWSFANPILASGEMGIELDTRQFKIGDGNTRWNLLPYGGIQGPAGPAGLILPPQQPTPGQVLTYVGGSPSSIQWRNPLSYNTTTIAIRAAKAATNFNFSSLPSQNYNIIPEAFGSEYVGSGVDSDGFSITLNPIYDMSNLPIITGTVAYWDPTPSPTYGKMNYIQVKFGDITNNQAVSMTVEPTTAITGVQTNLGSPLKLTISGVTSAICNDSVDNIGTGVLNYAVIVYLQLNN
jgi:hypothetical protein